MFRNLFQLLFSFSLILGVTNRVWTQTWVHGMAPDYKGEYVVVHRLADAISNQHVFVDKQIINEKGEFEFQWNDKAIAPYYFSIGSQVGILYVEPAKTYYITFPKPDPNAFQRFEGSEVSLELKHTNEQDINLLIRRFNQDYFEFINQHYYDFASGSYTNHRTVKTRLQKGGNAVDMLEPASANDTVSRGPSVFPEIVGRFRSRVDSIFGSNYHQEYFKDYVDYSISEIELLAGLGRKYYYQTYLMSRSLPYSNPAFGSAFKLFYKNALTNVSKENQNAISKAVNLEHSSDLLCAVFENDSITKSAEIRALMCLNGLQEMKSNGALLEPMVLATLVDFKEKSTNSSIAEVAGQILLSKQKYKQGWMLEDFTLVDSKGNKWTWSKEAEKATYFLFFATWSTASLKEMAMLQKLQVEFGDAIDIIAINMDKDIALMQKYMAENRGQNFLILTGLADPLIAGKMNVKSIPHAIFIDDEGRFSQTFARKPSEGVRLDFEKYMALLKSQNKSGVKTWKGQ